MLAKTNAAWRASPPPPRRTPRIFKRGQPADCGAGLAPLGGHHGSPSRRGLSRQRSRVATVPAAPVPSRGGRTVHRMQWRPTSPRKHREACCLDGQAPVLVVLWSCGDSRGSPPGPACVRERRAAIAWNAHSCSPSSVCGHGLSCAAEALGRCQNRGSRRPAAVVPETPGSQAARGRSRPCRRDEEKH